MRRFIEKILDIGICRAFSTMIFTGYTDFLLERYKKNFPAIKPLIFITTTMLVLKDVNDAWKEAQEHPVFSKPFWQSRLQAAAKWPLLLCTALIGGVFNDLNIPEPYIKAACYYVGACVAHTLYTYGLRHPNPEAGFWKNCLQNFLSFALGFMGVVTGKVFTENLQEVKTILPPVLGIIGTSVGSALGNRIGNTMSNWTTRVAQEPAQRPAEDRQR